MPILLKEIIPLGRTLREYELMFALTDADRQRKILGCADGPASFNAEWTARGGTVISVDPLYAFNGTEIRQRFAAVLDDVMANVDATSERWGWDFHRDVAGLRAHRVTAMERFAADYEAGKTDGRYQVGELPALAFPERSFDLALCSHFLFLYSHLLSTEFHVAALKELSRVATEVRVFPLVDLVGNPSPHLDVVRQTLALEGIATTLETVAYEFQKGGNQMLRAKRRT